MNGTGAGSSFLERGREMGSASGAPGWLRRLGRRVLEGGRIAVVGVLCGLFSPGASRLEASEYRIAEVREADQLLPGGGSQVLARGRALVASWSVRTGPAGLLLLIGAGQRLEFQGQSLTHLEKGGLPGAHTPVRSFLKPGPGGPVSAGARLRAADPVFELDSGTLLAEVGVHPLSLSCSLLEIDARNAVFALTAHPARGALVSVLKGQVKIRFPDKTVAFLNAGKSLRTAGGVPPQLGLLDEQSDSQEHKRGLTRLSMSTPPAPGVLGGEPVAGAIGTGVDAPFDLTRRRRAALLTAPNPDAVGQPEVSPELPAAQIPSN